MIGFFLRLGWRIIVGAVAVGLGVATVFLFFPYLDNHLPLLPSVIALYIVIAYVGIPLLVRLWHLFLKPTHLPHYAVSGDGWSSDPVNIAIVCKNKRQLRQHMERSGWRVADKATLKNSIKMGVTILLKKPYPTAPFSKLYMFGRPQDIGFQIQTGNPPTPRHRHHIRFWLLNTDAYVQHSHHSFWDNILKIFNRNRQQIWIGTATHDIGPFAFRIRNFQLTHQIDEQTNREREYVIQTLKDAGAIRRVETIDAGDPVMFRGQTFGVNIITDGTLPVVELKNKPTRPSSQ